MKQMLPTTARFLIVDDMLTMRKIIAKFLRDCGYQEISEAKDGNIAKEMLNQASASGKPIDCVISDWNMPEMTGLELLKYCRQTQSLKNLLFLLVTAEADTKQLSEASASGVDGYLSKPFTLEVFQQKLKESVANRKS